MRHLTTHRCSAYSVSDSEVSPRRIEHCTTSVSGLASVLASLNTSGVYFLMHRESVVYVGQAMCMLTRIGSHTHEGSKQFDDVRIMKCERHDLSFIEACWIQALKPKYNWSKRGHLVNICPTPQSYRMRSVKLGHLLPTDWTPDAEFDAAEPVCGGRGRVRLVVGQQ